MAINHYFHGYEAPFLMDPSLLLGTAVPFVSAYIYIYLYNIFYILPHLWDICPVMHGFSPLTSTGYSCQVLLVQIPIDTIDLAAYFQGPATQRSN